MTTRLAIGITLGLAISASALADVSGTYQMEDTRMVISVRVCVLLLRRAAINLYNTNYLL